MGKGGSSSDESLRPWSGPLIKATLEYVIGDRPSSTDPAQDRMWKSRAEELMFWANRRPDVAARTLACSFFSELAIVPPPPATTSANANPPPKLPSKLHDMCQHALHVHASYCNHEQHVATSGASTTGGGGGGNARAKEIPQEEVTFMATLVEPCVRPPGKAKLPNCRGALESMFQQGGNTARAAGVEHFLRRPIQRLLFSNITSSDTFQGQRDSYRRAATVPVELIPSSALLPPDSAAMCDTAMFFPSFGCERQSAVGGSPPLSPPSVGYHSSLASMTPGAAPFQVRGREETTREAVKEDARLRSSTLVRVEERATIARPQWAAAVEAQYSRFDEIADEATDKARESGSGKAGEERDTSPIAENGEKPVPTKVEATIVEEGELVFVNGRFVVIQEAHKKRKEKPAKDTPHAKPPAEGENGMPVTVDEKAAPHCKRQREANTPDDTKDIDGEEPLAASSTARRGRRIENGKRVQKTKNAPQSQSPIGAAVISVQGVPLRSREELVDMVNALNISETLRGAFLIGLEPPCDSGSGKMDGHPGERQDQKVAEQQLLSLPGPRDDDSKAGIDKDTPEEHNEETGSNQADGEPCKATHATFGSNECLLEGAETVSSTDRMSVE